MIPFYSIIIKSQVLSSVLSSTMFYVQPFATWKKKACGRAIAAFLDKPLQSRQRMSQSHVKGG